MRILWLSKVPPATHTPRVWQVARRLTDRGHVVRILTCRIDPSLPAREVRDGVEIEYLRTAPDLLLRRPVIGFYASRLPWYAVAAPALRHSARRCRVDVAVEDLAPVGGMSVDLAAGGLRIPLVQDVHYLLGSTTDWLRMYGAIGLWGSAYERLLTSGRLQPSALVSDSQELLDRLGRARPDIPARWIPNGVELDRFGEGGGVHSGIELLAVGRLAAPKGHTHLVEAMAMLRDRPDIRLRIVGDGPLLETLRALARDAGVGDRVAFTGRLPHDRLHEAYEQADIFVMPSLAEGLPIALVEALGARLPVIASDIPGHRQVADDSVMTFVPPADASALAVAIRRLADEPGTRDLLGARSRALAESRYSWETVTDAFEDVLLRTVAGGPMRRARRPTTGRRP